ncbi:MAG: hypothetical protein QOD83_2714 [Solirubrobacteraceae bacterium]|nr:hypothetical protein [Solirubrobacteraceae bacterium]
MSAPSTDRLQQLAALYAKHDAQLLSVVGRRVAAQPATVADACSYAWAQLLAAEHIDLTVPVGLTGLADEHRRARGMAPGRAQMARHTAQPRGPRRDRRQHQAQHRPARRPARSPRSHRQGSPSADAACCCARRSATEHATYTTTRRLIADAKRKLR